MKNLVILGAGTAGTMMASHLKKKLSKLDWEITIVDQNKTHYYQPGFLFLPFDTYKPEPDESAYRVAIEPLGKVGFQMDLLEYVVVSEKITVHYTKNEQSRKEF